MSGGKRKLEIDDPVRLRTSACIQTQAFDNYLIKEAAQSGCSLRGLSQCRMKTASAVSYEKLVAHWHAMLYDPRVSKSAAAGIAEMHKFPGTQQQPNMRGVGGSIAQPPSQNTVKPAIKPDPGGPTVIGNKERRAFFRNYDNVLHAIERNEVVIGRETTDNHVDINIGDEGEAAKKVSRKQCEIKQLGPESYQIMNMGKRPIQVDENELQRDETAVLKERSSIEFCGLQFEFILAP